MKKIGLLTFHASHNCGSMLQTFALQSILQDLGYNVEIINFSNTNQKKLYSIFYENNNLKNILKNVILFFHINKIKNTNLEYQKFIYDNFNLSENSFERTNELKEDLFDYNIYVCGSDQIWNTVICDGDDAYFLPFVKKHLKIAYAPSFGAKNPKKFKKEYQKYAQFIASFDFVSVRENNGQKWIKDLTGIDVPIVLDPTLVVNKEKYTLIECPLQLPEKYIFYYAPGYMKDITKFVQKVAKKYNLPVVVFNSKQFYVKGLNLKRFIIPKLENPSTYLWLIKNAQIVFTTSYHGTIFSTIYRKVFWTLKNTDMFEDDDRVRTLVNQLGMESRVILPLFDKEFNYLENPDYEKYEKKLDVLVCESKQFLISALANKDKE